MATKIKHVIVAVDMSKHADLIVREAKRLAGKLSAKIVYVHVFEDTGIFSSKFRTKKSEVKKAYEKEIKKKFSLTEKDRVLICYGKPYEEIISIAKKFELPMIVAGHRGINPLVTLLLGSTAERLALLSPVPVWIHRGARTVLPQKILVPCDLSSRSKHTIGELDKFKSAFSPSLELFHVREEPLPILDFQSYNLISAQMMKVDQDNVENFKKKNTSYKLVTELGGVVECIRARAKKFDIIALSPREHSSSSHFMGSITAKLLGYGNTPIVIFP